MTSIKPSLPLLLLFNFLLLIPNLQAQDNDSSITFDSPDGSIKLTFGLDDDIPYYSVDRIDRTVIEKIRLEIELHNSGPQENRFSFIKCQENGVTVI